MIAIVDITQICNYDGMCLFSQKNAEDREHGFCYGDKYGSECCPLKHNHALIEIKKEKIKEVADIENNFLLRSKEK